MNERLLELADQVMEDLHGPWNIPDEFCKKFAELIVQECIKEIEFQYGGGNLMEDGNNSEWDNAIECVSAMIKHHFGVK